MASSGSSDGSSSRGLYIVLWLCCRIWVRKNGANGTSTTIPWKEMKTIISIQWCKVYVWHSTNVTEINQNQKHDNLQTYCPIHLWGKYNEKLNEIWKSISYRPPPPPKKNQKNKTLIQNKTKPTFVKIIHYICKCDFDLTS